MSNKLTLNKTDIEMVMYEVKQTAVSQVLADVRSDKIAISELQRPFVWKTSQVRDLMDSLYNGYPVGYLITWLSVGAKLKGGQVACVSENSKVSHLKNAYIIDQLELCNVQHNKSINTEGNKCAAGY